MGVGSMGYKFITLQHDKWNCDPKWDSLGRIYKVETGQWSESWETLNS